MQGSGMKISPDQPIPNGLVAWYGLYQTSHILVNTRGLAILLSGRVMDFPAPPPDAGWSQDVVHLMIAIGILDLANAVAAMLFVWGYFKKTHWRMWLGTLTLTVSVYAAGIYAYWTYMSGAWAGDNAIVYVIVNGAFLPILVLWCLSCYWGAKQPANWVSSRQRK